jgi:acyl-CoA synthetase (AMP-forming)/AMP-acid ligase II
VGIAIVVPLADREISADDLVAHLEQRLARFKIPKDFRVLDELPRTAYGKVVKGELRDRYMKERE